MSINQRKDTGVVVDDALCVGCAECVKGCPFGALRVDHMLAEADMDLCTLCGACEALCPYDAIRVDRPAASSATVVDLSGYRDVWVVVELTELGEVAPVTLELLGEGRRLADTLGEALCAVVLGADVSAAVASCYGYGADLVRAVAHAELSPFRDEPHAAVLAELIMRHQPSVVLAGATARGRGLIPRVAVLTGTGLTADCTSLGIDLATRQLLQTRPAFGGNVMATILTPRHRPQMATVRHKVFEPAVYQSGRPCDFQLEEVAAALLQARTQRVSYAAASGAHTLLSEADIVVAGGLGMQSPAGFGLLDNLANVLGAAVADSRPVVDAGWVDYPMQVGQTGQTVCPRIYIAVGISGQIQHLAGMGSSEMIVAINSDESAPIFGVATYGIVGDALEVVPVLTRALGECLAGK